MANVYASEEELHRFAQERAEARVKPRDHLRDWGPIITNTSRPGDTPEQTAARAAPRGVRKFDTGATRDLDENKLDFEGFLSPPVLKAYAEYMHEKRKMPDGSLRDSDNWQLGIPLDAYMKSMWRHFFAVWEGHRNGNIAAEDLKALFFNVHGYLHETLKAKRDN